MSFGDIVSVVILPVLVLLSLLTQSKDFTPPWTLRTIWFFIFSLFILLFSIYSGLDGISERNTLKNKIENLGDDLKITDSILSNTKDTLVNIGLRIDDKTGRLLVMDSQLLKKEFSQIFNITYADVTQQENERLIASSNYAVRETKDSLFISPKTGAWSHGYIAFDTSNSTKFENKLENFMHYPTPVDAISVNGKVYNTRIWKVIERAVFKDKPMSINISDYKNRYIIFGDEGVPYKRYIYHNGVTRWIPED